MKKTYAFAFLISILNPIHSSLQASSQEREIYSFLRRKIEEYKATEALKKNQETEALREALQESFLKSLANVKKMSELAINAQLTYDVCLQFDFEEINGRTSPAGTCVLESTNKKIEMIRYLQKNLARQEAPNFKKNSASFQSLDLAQRRDKKVISKSVNVSEASSTAGTHVTRDDKIKMAEYAKEQLQLAIDKKSLRYHKLDVIKPNN